MGRTIEPARLQRLPAMETASGVLVRVDMTDSSGSTERGGRRVACWKPTGGFHGYCQERKLRPATLH